jgi:hypothetical protein
MLYLAERYEDLSEEELGQLRLLGERYCQPVMNRPQAPSAETEAETASVT